MKEKSSYLSAADAQPCVRAALREKPLRPLNSYRGFPGNQVKPLPDDSQRESFSAFRFKRSFLHYGPFGLHDKCGLVKLQILIDAAQMGCGPG